MKKIIWGVIGVVIILAIILLARGGQDQEGLTEEARESDQPALTSMTDGDNTIAVADQEADGNVVNIDLAVLANGGFVVIHEDADGTFGADIGNSQHLIGTHEQVKITLDRQAETGETLHAMLHRDTNDNGVYEFPGADTPIQNVDGQILVVAFQVTGNTQAEADAGADAEAGADTEVEVDLDTGTDTAEVTYTDSGFSPATLTVSAGTTVVFRNQSSSSFWPASAVHPTHTVYPGSGINKCGTIQADSIFDACAGVAPGGDYSFTLNETGNWGYHNHLQPGHTGRVMVE